ANTGRYGSPIRWMRSGRVIAGNDDRFCLAASQRRARVSNVRIGILPALAVGSRLNGNSGPDVGKPKTKLVLTELLLPPARFTFPRSSSFLWTNACCRGTLYEGRCFIVKPDSVSD